METFNSLAFVILAKTKNILRPKLSYLLNIESASTTRNNYQRSFYEKFREFLQNELLRKEYRMFSDLRENLSCVMELMKRHSSIPKCSNSCSKSRYNKMVNIMFGSVFLPPTIWEHLKKEKEITKKSDETQSLDSVLGTADALLSQRQYQRAVALLVPHAGSNNVEVLWRLGSALFCLPNRKVVHLERALEYLKTAEDISPTHHEVLVWMAVTLDALGHEYGVREQIRHMESVKKHLIRAVDADPNDSTTMCILGHMCYTLASLPWYRVSLASVIWANPPRSSFVEALYWFEKAANINPHCCHAMLMVAKTYLQMGQEELAKSWLQKTMNCPIVYQEALADVREAGKLLDNLNKRKYSIFSS